MKIIYSIVLLSTIGISCHQSKTAVGENRAADMEDGIMLGSLDEVGMDSILISDMNRAIVDNEYPNIHSILIARNGKLVYENYFPGQDEIWGNSIGFVKHHQDSLHDVRSVSKSVVSACIGIAIAQGNIKSVEQKIWDFFPEFKAFNTGEKSNITIKHLLTMTAGLEWNENLPYTDPANSEIQMSLSDDPDKYVLSRKLVDPPGTKWNYSGGTTHILATIIKKTTGLEIDEFAQKHLFKPLGITHSYWIRFSSPQSNIEFPVAASGLRLRSRDMVKFGLLYMNKGVWNEEQILPQSWVMDSHKSHVDRDGPDQGYGYQFWIWQENIKGKPVKMVAAVGNGDQRIFFDDENDLLVVTTAGNYNTFNISNNANALLRNYIYPSFKKYLSLKTDNVLLYVQLTNPNFKYQIEKQ